MGLRQDPAKPPLLREWKKQWLISGRKQPWIKTSCREHWSITRGLKSPCLAPFPFKILLASRASRLDRKRLPSSTCREEKGEILLLLPGEEGQLCLIKLACFYTKAGAAGRVMLSLALASQTDTSTKPIHQLLAQQLARLVTSFRAQEGVTSLACRADTKARFYLSHCVFLQVSLPAFHANINNCGYLCSQESDCLGGGKL